MLITSYIYYEFVSMSSNICNNSFHRSNFSAMTKNKMRNYYVAFIYLIKCLNCINYKFTENSFNSEDNYVSNKNFRSSRSRVRVNFKILMSKTKYEQDRYRD